MKSRFALAWLIVACGLRLGAAEYRLVEHGNLNKRLAVAESWASADGFLSSSPGKRASLIPNIGIGPGDFQINARLRITRLNNSACGLSLRRSFFGFEGAHGKIFLTGKLFDGARGLAIGDPADFMEDAKAFDFQVIRKGKRIRFSIDGKNVHDRAITDEPLGRFGFSPSRAIIAVSDLRVTGEFDAKYLNYIPAAEAYQIKSVPGVDKVVLLPPGPKNPRNSEGDFIHLKDGRLMFLYTHFTSGTSDHAAAHLAARYSRDQGRTWTETDENIIGNEGGYNVMSVSLLRLQDGRIALFYLRKNSLADCRPLLRFSSDEARTWSDPVEVITDQIGYFVHNNDRAIQLQSGRLVCPVALHRTPDYEKPDWDGKLMCYLSDDLGRTWRRSRSVLRGVKPDGKRITYQEPGVVELKDGRVMMFIRTGEGSQHLSWSEDGGETWSKSVPSVIKSPKSPATIERIPGTGNLLMAWNDHSLITPDLKGKRTPLAVAVSRDNGETWQTRHVLEDDPNGWYCYTAMAFVGDRVVLGHCAGDRRLGGLNTTQITSFNLDLLGASD